ncbi:MAG: Ig-like domain-containing protein, partial [Gammaproteobacteria bacterium]|nr:Ig-like domain-containing protein [Gammaproteobacteria bacterium]
MANFDDGSQTDITSEVTWDINSDLASISSNGELSINNLIDVLPLKATYQDVTASVDVSISQMQDANVSRVYVDPSLIDSLQSDSELAIETEYSDGSIQKNVTVAVQDIQVQSDNSKKLILSINEQPVTLFVPATYDTNSSQLSLTVALNSIEINLDKNQLTSGESTAFSLTAFYSNDTSETVVADSWEISGPVALNANKTVLTAYTVTSPTQATLSATFNELSVTQAIEITPQVTPDAVLQSITLSNTSLALEINQSRDLVATAHYDTGATELISTGINWSSSNTAIATVNSSGHVTALAEGNSVIKASYNGFDASLNLQVSPDAIVLDTITIDNGDINLETNGTATLSVTANYSNNTSSNASSVTWQSANTTIATVSNTGVVTAKAEGSTTITATYNNKSDTITVNVQALTATLDSIAINDGDRTLTVNETADLIVTASYSNNTSSTDLSAISWESSNTNAVTVSASGQITAVAEGNATITATYQQKVASISVTVNPEPVVLESIDITTNSTQLNTFEAVDIAATGHYSNESTQDITSAVSWSSSNADVLSVDATNGTKLKAGNTSGNVVITASLDGISVEQDFSVVVPDTAEISSLSFAISLPSTYLLNSPYTLPPIYANYSDGSRTLVTDQVSWTSSNTDIASINSTQFSTGSLVGSATLTATHDVSGKTIDMNVVLTTSANATLSQVYLYNPPSTMFFNRSEPLQLRAMFSDNSEAILNSGISWTTDKTNLATVDSMGSVTSKNVEGYVVVKATYTDANSVEYVTTIGINILPENSFENLALTLDNYPQRTLIEDNSDYPPQLKVFNNPVGIIDGMVFLEAIPGDFLTYVNPVTNEKLVMILPGLEVGAT